MAKILLGITGSIAAYKAAALASALVKEGHEVHAILTANACRFVTPLTLQTITSNRAVADMFEGGVSYDPSHVSLARGASLLVIAPATANVIAKMAAGIADDMLSTTYLSVNCPVLVAPAMHSNMYMHPATQENLNKLKSRGVRLVGPGEGRLASGDTGPGRMAEPEEITEVISNLLSK